ncbi:MAG: hypothetical protein K2X01_01965 [Cyanobacteria bacterium]|nr:hypothetical protein [Cyanobacteriota bacterium]
MSYKNDSEIVILNRYGKASSFAKAELFETYDRLRDLTDSGPAIGGSGLGKFSSVFLNIARMFGSSNFIPTFGSEAMNIPGTSYYSPISGGTGTDPGGQAAFGLAPFSQVSGYSVGGAAPIDGSGGALASLGALGTGLAGLGFSGIGDADFPTSSISVGGLNNGIIAGGAVSPFVQTPAAATAGGLAVGATAGAGFGRNWVMPAAGIVSGIGGMLTTLGPFFGPFGLAAAAGGSVLNGVAGAVLASYQHISNRILTNADTILGNKVKNLETTVKMLDAQSEVVKKLLKESLDGDKKALENI